MWIYPTSPHVTYRWQCTDPDFDRAARDPSHFGLLKDQNSSCEKISWTFCVIKWSLWDIFYDKMNMNWLVSKCNVWPHSHRDSRHHTENRSGHLRQIRTWLEPKAAPKYLSTRWRRRQKSRSRNRQMSGQRWPQKIGTLGCRYMSKYRWLGELIQVNAPQSGGLKTVTRRCMLRDRADHGRLLIVTLTITINTIRFSHNQSQKIYWSREEMEWSATTYLAPQMGLIRKRSEGGTTWPKAPKIKNNGKQKIILVNQTGEIESIGKP